MTLKKCFICKRPVLELKGQFHKLDTYFLNEQDDIAYEQGAFGWCHTSCLSKSSWGSFWSERRISHMTSIMGYLKLLNSTDLTVLFDPRRNKYIVLRSDGVAFYIELPLLKYKKDCPTGIMLPVFEEMNLELDEPELAHKICDTLAKTKSFPLQDLVNALDLNDTLLYPDAIIDGVLLFNKALKENWGDNWTSGNASYSEFIPQEVLDAVLSA